LESPGLGPTLLGGTGADLGLVDLLVAETAGAKPEEMPAVRRTLHELTELDLAGEVWVQPAAGSARDYDYVARLSRVMLSTGVGGGLGERLDRSLRVAEAEVVPDVVILDSRAGVHDLAANAVTRLSTHAFLFGVDSAQTWAGMDCSSTVGTVRGWLRRFGRR
jgi:hypothetical protein